MHRSRFALAVLMLLATSAQAGIDAAGTTSANFLSVGNGAAIVSMGGAAIGTGGSLNAAAWNPASLGLLAGPQYSISHATLAMETSQDWLSAGGRFRNGATRWSLSAIYENDGDFEGRDAFGASTGTFNASNLAFGAGFARPFGEVFSLGAGVKWVNEYLGEVSGSGLCFDLGVQGHSGAFGFGAAARNIGGSMKFDSGSYPMPAVYGVGASWADPVRGLRLNLDANFPSDYYNDVRFGAEWMWQNRVALRTGYRMEVGATGGEPLGGPTFGMGAGTNGMWVDYAFLAGQTETQGAHRLSFSVHPGFMNPGGFAMAPTPVAPRDPLAIVREPAKPAEQQPVAIVREPAKPAEQQPVAIVREPAKPAEQQPVAIVREPAKPAEQQPVAIVREPAKPAVSMPAAAPPVAVASPKLPAPVLRVSNASEPVAAVAPVPVVRIEAPADAGAESPEARQIAVAPRPLRTDKSARVPKLVVPKAEPVAIVREPVKPAQPAEAPVAVVAPAPARPVAAPPRRDEPKPDMQLAASAPVTPVVVPQSAPSTEPIARPAAPVVPAKPAARPAQIVVQKNQTLADIAKLYDNSVPALMMENNLVSDQVKPGQKIKLPPAGKK
ncbi:MAG: PorV/PorQ family protein [Candidatus Eisenbacteria bacterium]|uniref:PorV/PorQ family protein n=1 Tax=Eiseniibacteriota bacterium TaxID=2212470 RepID=A0A933SDN8_UNCEI|nr:PorV/PorQ family protein [Candidatus Eisenbacteria bacterium]